MLPNDYDLKTSDIQTLAHAEAVVALFTLLGYNTNVRLKQTPQAMGFPEGLARDVISMERIADQEQGELQVYLIELKHVTVAITQSLARVFKNRAGLFLLVLTADYERLDFVLLEPSPLGEKSEKTVTGRAPINLRPRTLTIKRTNPDIVALRVLRRFTYTEVDVDYQLDKLCSAYNIADWAEPFFNNRALFSDYYLNERLKDTPEWAENALLILRSFEKLLFNARAQWGSEPVSTTRSTLILPALELVGFRAQPGNPSAERAQIPDYLLFDPQQPDQPIACCNAYAWDRDLDGLVDDARDPDNANENPGARVISVLENETNPEWAIVTNGKFWRLYTRRAHSRAANYYEIDLEEALASPDPGLAFRYFWLFFRCAAFSLTPEPRLARSPSPTSGNGASFLAWLLAECNQYARQLETRLKERVFEEIFHHLAEGFIAHMGGVSALLRLPAAEREQILLDTFQGTLTFLYRLLFLFYAESRNLLPASEVRGYWEISLARLKKEIAERAGTISDEVENKLKQAYRTDSYELYDRLFHLFRMIDLGESSINVPTYNGGLFVTDTDPSDDSPDATNSRFLATHKIPDRFLALGLDHMARDIDPRRGDLVMIDYKSLGVQQLGSIYEGLIEFKLRLATEKMSIVHGKKTEEVIPYAEAQKTKRIIMRKGRSKNSPERLLPRGTVYLENDRAERKATGSYYTPDYIVKYIVRNTVGLVLDEKFNSLRPRMREAQKAYFTAVERQKGFIKTGQSGDDPKKIFNTPESQAVVDDFFDLRVLDPAMGSGHFLVEAVDFITDRMLAYLNAFPDNPIIHALARTRQTILEEMKRQEINIDPARLTNVNLLKRHVLKRCIYGVDLNRMAVELAKVSLWLHCFTLGAPLSFLDHHLRQGNSLIGVWKLEDYIITGSGRWNDLVRTLTNIVQISKLTDSTAGQVKESYTLYRASQESIRQARERLNTEIAVYFSEFGAIGQAAQVAYMTAEQRAGVTPLTLEKFIKSQAIARDRKFFHWKLEFPEVFIDLDRSDWKKNPGFDAVIGNPPYDVTLDYAESKFIDDNVNKSKNGRLDSAALFVENFGFEVRQSCRIGFLLPHRLLSRQRDFGNHQKYVYNQKLLFQILYLGAIPEIDANDEFMIGIYKPGYEGDFLVSYGKFIISKEPLTASFIQIPRQSWGAPKFRFNIYLAEFSIPLLRKIESISFPMGDICESRDGIVVYLREKLLSETPKDNRYVPFIGVGGFYSLTPYSLEYDEIFLCYDLDEARKYIKDPKELRKVQLRDRNIFEQSEKIFTSQDAIEIKATIDRSKLFHSNSIHSTFLRETSSYRLEYIVAILNNPLTSYYYKTLNLKATELHPQILVTNLPELPIRRIDFTTPTALRDVLVSEAQDLTNLQNLSGLLRFVDARIAAQPIEIDVIHDLLAYLSGQMIDLNQQRQAEMKRFLVWLEGALQIRPDAKTGKAGLEAISPKDRLKNYLGDYQKKQPELSYAELEDILERNKNKLGISLNEARFAARLRQEYKASLAVLHPLKARLAWTDKLIDQIVYQLYGLTEEEITIVEGKS